MDLRTALTPDDEDVGGRPVGLRPRRGRDGLPAAAAAAGDSDDGKAEAEEEEEEEEGGRPDDEPGGTADEEAAPDDDGPGPCWGAAPAEEDGACCR